MIIGQPLILLAAVYQYKSKMRAIAEEAARARRELQREHTTEMDALLREIDEARQAMLAKTLPPD